MAAPIPATPLLLTKRLNAFLHANQTPQLPTLLLTTNQGKLLAHASAEPVSVLRTHGTVAASLLSIHTSSSVALPSALPGSATPDHDHDHLGDSSSPPPPHDQEDDEETARGTDDEAEHQAQQQQQNSTAATAENNNSTRPRKPSHDSVKPVTITVQLSGGTVVIRRLKCGLLLVCVGPSAHSDGTQPRSVDASSSSESGGGVVVATASSDAESLTSAQTTTSLDSAAATSVVAMRKHANELARWLDDKLGSLNLPDDGTVFG